MAKIIDKIVKSKNAPQSTNVLWDDGENLKIYRNGVWEITNKNTGGDIDPVVWKYMCNPYIYVRDDGTPLPSDLRNIIEDADGYLKNITFKVLLIGNRDEEDNIIVSIIKNINTGYNSIELFNGVTLYYIGGMFEE